MSIPHPRSESDPTPPSNKDTDKSAAIMKQITWLVVWFAGKLAAVLMMCVEAILSYMHGWSYWIIVMQMAFVLFFLFLIFLDGRELAKLKAQLSQTTPKNTNS